MAGKLFHRPNLSLVREASPTDAGAGAAMASRPSAPPTLAEAQRFREIVLPHLDAAYGFARFLSRDAAVAEDLTQEAFLRAFRAFGGYRGGDAKAWLFAIVRSCFLSWLRAQRAWSEITIPEAVETVEAPTDEASPEEAHIRAADTAAVREALLELPDPFREALVLRELEEMSYRQIAELTGAPTGTVMSRMARGRRLLAQSLRGAGA